MTELTVPVRKELTGLLTNLLQLVGHLEDLAHLEKSASRMKVTVAELDGEIQNRKQQIAALDAGLAECKAKAEADAAIILADAKAKHDRASEHEVAARESAIAAQREANAHIAKAKEAASEYTSAGEALLAKARTEASSIVANAARDAAKHAEKIDVAKAELEGVQSEIAKSQALLASIKDEIARVKAKFRT